MSDKLKQTREYKKPLAFTKMQGAGNDFVIIDSRYGFEGSPQEIAGLLCDRHFGIGADGIVLVGSSTQADFKMSYYNADGSDAICGNAIRCVARYVFERGLLPGGTRAFTIETGVRNVDVEVFGQGQRVKVNMGEPIFEGRYVPTSEAGPQLNRSLEVEGREFIISAVGMGNPHAVLFIDDVDTFPVEEIGRQIENHPFFPERTNVEFVELKSRNQAKMRVWERGVGETLACGTGICAIAAAGFKTERTSREINISAPGGEFSVLWSEGSGNIFLTGPAQEVFSGVLDLDYLATCREQEQVSCLSNL